MKRVLQPLFSLLFNVEPFKSRIRVLAGAGVAVDQRPCGCILRAVHKFEAKEWVFYLDYSNCREHQDTPAQAFLMLTEK